MGRIGFKGEGQWAEPVLLTFHYDFSSFSKVVSKVNFFLEINQSETRIAYGGHVCNWIQTK